MGSNLFFILDFDEKLQKTVILGDFAREAQVRGVLNISTRLQDRLFS